MGLVNGISLVFGLLVAYSECTCNFPNALSGTWESSDFGMLEVNSTTIGPITISSYGALQFECYDVVGSKFISRSTTATRIGVSDGYFYLCMDLRYQSNNKYIYYLQSNKESSAGDMRVKVFAVSVTPTSNQICDTTVGAHTYDMLIKNETVSSETVSCPSWISGTFNYTDRTGLQCATSGSSISNCDDTSILSLNRTLCNFKIFPTDAASVGCLYHTSAGNVQYLTVYGTDYTPATEFICLIGEPTSDGYRVLVNADRCPDTDTPSTVSLSQPLVSFTLLESCPLPPTNPPTSTATTPPAPVTEPSRSSAARTTIAVVVAIVSLAAHAF